MVFGPIARWILCSGLHRLHTSHFGATSIIAGLSEPEPAWHRKARANRAKARKLLRTHSAIHLLQQHHGSAPPLSVLQASNLIMGAKYKGWWICHYCGYNHPGTHSSCPCRSTFTPPPPPPPPNRRWGGNNRRNYYANPEQRLDTDKGKGKDKGGKGKHGDSPFGTDKGKSKDKGGKGKHVSNDDIKDHKGKGGLWKGKNVRDGTKVVDADVIEALQGKNLPGDLMDAIKQHLQAHDEPMGDVDPEEHKETWQRIQSIKAKLKSLESSIVQATTAVDTAEEWLDKQRQARDALYDKRDDLQDKLDSLAEPQSTAHNPIEKDYQSVAEWTKGLIQAVKGGGKGDIGSHDDYDHIWSSIPAAVQTRIFNETQPEFDPLNGRTSVPWIRAPNADPRETGGVAHGYDAPAAAAAGASRRARGRAGEEDARGRRRSASRSPPPLDEATDLVNSGRPPAVQVASSR